MQPKGVATLLPEATARQRYIEETLLSVFRQWGYQEVIPPLFEYLDVISLGLGEDMIERAYKFVDRGSGRLMLLRPDVTPQIARMSAMLMADAPKPLRLCYRANVFRHEEEHAGRAREVFQIGGELIGPPGPEADAEVIAIAIESLRRLGLTDFKAVLGHNEFFKGLLNSLNLPMEIQRRIKTAVARKDLSRLEEILKSSSVPRHRAQALLAMPRLFGREEVLRRAGALSEASGCKAALARLQAVYQILKSSGWGDCLMIDLSELRGFDYYTGVVFEIFAKDLGHSVGRGGRYDQLIGKFGVPSPSTGFAFDVEHVQWAWQQGESRRRVRLPSPEANGPALTAADLLLVGLSPDPRRLFQVARMLREKGLRVIQQSASGGGPITPGKAYEQARAMGIGSVALLTAPDRVTWIDGKTGARRSLTLKAVLSAASRKRKPGFSSEA
jgi:ATP phosphoribosyltransferase regulatory subunit